MKKSILIFVTILIAQFTIAQQYIDTLDIRFSKLKMNNLKNHQSNYLVTLENANGDLMNTAIWTRTTKKENETFIISQYWRNANKKATKKLYSILNARNFQPIFHKVTKGTGEISAYNFKERKIIGADSVANNSKKDFSLAVERLPYNWELDIEFFQLMPLKLNTTFVVEFYHPGGSKNPAYYQYKVEGKENIEMPDGSKAETWIVKIEYSKGNEATFWIGVDNQSMLKMKEISGPFKSTKIKI